MPIGAIIGGVAAIGGAAISAGAVNNASNAASQAAAANNALESQIYNTNKGLETPYIDRGNTAADALQGFLGLGGDPSKTQAAFNDFLNSTGYQFQRDQGLNAVTQSKAVGGLLNSGSTLKALDAYGTGLADQYGNQWASDLAGVSGQGANAVNALAGQGQTYANAYSNNNNSAASATANAGLAGASIDSSLINSALNAYGTQRGASSWGGSPGMSAWGNIGTGPGAEGG